MDIPKNCKECQFSYSCKGPCYGGSHCLFKDEISAKMKIK